MVLTAELNCLTSTNFVSGKQKLWLDCRDVRSDLGCHCSLYHKAIYLHCSSNKAWCGKTKLTFSHMQTCSSIQIKHFFQPQVLIFILPPWSGGGHPSYVPLSICPSMCPFVTCTIVRIYTEHVHKGHRTLNKLFLLELLNLVLLRRFVLYTWHSRVLVSVNFYSFQDNDLKLAAKKEYRLDMCMKVTELWAKFYC